MRAPPTTTRLHSALRACGVLLCALAVVACSPYKMVGNQAFRFAEKQVIPYSLADNDMVIACHAGETLAAPALTFEAVGTDIRRMAILINTANGLCAEADAFEQELLVMRALRQNNPYAAGDARIVQKRLLEKAARYELTAWRHFVDFYRVKQGGKCPRLRGEFDEMVYLVGLIAGVEALLNDAQTNQSVGVSRDIVPMAAQFSTCLAPGKWWDLPLSIRVAMWNILPSTGPEDAEPMKILHEIAKRGGEQGMHIGYVSWAMSAWGGGDQVTTRQAIREYVASVRTGKVDAQYRLLNVVAHGVMLGMSDRIWTEAEGYRTPQGALGTFPNDKPEAGLPSIDDLLE